MNTKDAEHDPQTIRELISKIRTAMLVTRWDDSFDARPLQAYPSQDTMEIFFMTDAHRIIEQIEADNRVMLTFAHKGGNDFVALNGSAVVTNDRQKIKELWTVWAEAFWKSPEDPAIRVITVTPDHARYWNGPGPVVSTIAMVAGVVSGKQPKLGTSGETSL